MDSSSLIGMQSGNKSTMELLKDSMMQQEKPSMEDLIWKWPQLASLSTLMSC